MLCISWCIRAATRYIWWTFLHYIPLRDLQEWTYDPETGRVYLLGHLFHLCFPGEKTKVKITFVSLKTKCLKREQWRRAGKAHRLSIFSRSSRWAWMSLWTFRSWLPFLPVSCSAGGSRGAWLTWLSFLSWIHLQGLKVEETQPEVHSYQRQSVQTSVTLHSYTEFVQLVLGLV